MKKFLSLANSFLIICALGPRPALPPPPGSWGVFDYHWGARFPSVSHNPPPPGVGGRSGEWSGRKTSHFFFPQYISIYCYYLISGEEVSGPWHALPSGLLALRLISNQHRISNKNYCQC